MKGTMMKNVIGASWVLLIGVTGSLLAGNMLFSDGFEDGYVEGWHWLSGPDLSASPDAAFAGSYGAKMSTYPYAAGGYIQSVSDPNRSTIVFSFAMNWSPESQLTVGRMSNAWALYNVNGYSVGGGIGTLGACNDKGSIRLFVTDHQSGRRSVGTASADTWYWFQACVDLASNTVDYYINDVQVLDDTEMCPKIWADQPDNSVSFGGGGDAFTVTRFDEFSVEEYPVVDFNADGTVDELDVLVLVANWGVSEEPGGTGTSLCDIAPLPFGDGVVDARDLLVLAEHMVEEAKDVNDVDKPD